MTERVFHLSVIAVAAAFSLFFAATVLPPLAEDPDVLGAFAAGFVNPYAAGYSADVFACWAILAVWVFHEARTRAVRRGWVCLVLGVVPGVAVGFAAYLVLRSRAEGTRREAAA